MEKDFCNRGSQRENVGGSSPKARFGMQAELVKGDLLN
jgi:hypothetical protein